MLTGKRDAEDGQRCVALKLVDQPVAPVDFTDHDAEEVVEHTGHLLWRVLRGELCRTHKVDEEQSRFSDIAGKRSALLDRTPRYVGSDAAAEQITHDVAFSESRHHVVESAL